MNVEHSATSPRRAPRLGFLLPVLCGGVCFAFGLRLYGLAVPAVVLLALVAAWLGCIGVGVAFMGSGIFARPILSGAALRGQDRLALTFDDGPHPVHTRRVLDLLDAHHHRATFFVIGERAAAAPELLAEIVQRGHGLGNHSLRHARTTTFQPVDRLTDELLRTNAILQRASGARPRWFRPPAGLLSPRVAAAAAKAGLDLVGWSATARDGTTRATVEGSLSRLLRGLRPGAILVLHDAAERDDREPIAPAVLARLLSEMKARSLRSVTLDELLLGATARGT